MDQSGTIAGRLEQLRVLMKQNSLNALIISSKDEFLNEYVDKETSKRIYYSGFTGTAGDLLITLDEAYIMVDGRYHAQAERQLNKDLYKVEKVGIDENGQRITEYIPDRLVKLIGRLARGKNLVIGFDPAQFSVKNIGYLKEKIDEISSTAVFTPLNQSFLDEINVPSVAKTVKPLYLVPVEIAGLSIAEKLKLIREKLVENNLNAIFVTKLDEIAYVTNLRSDEILYNSTFKSYLFIGLQDAFLFTDPAKLGCMCLRQMQASLDILSFEDMDRLLAAYINRHEQKYHIGYDPISTTCAIKSKLNMLISKSCKLIEVDNNPIKDMKAVKNDQELAYIQDCLTKADNAFHNTIQWVNKQINNGEKVSEKTLKDKIEEEFKAYNASRLSFETIAAVKSNSAVIHYTSSSDENFAEQGDLVLLDSGAYFRAGYATDLTRTFVAGGEEAKPHHRMKKVYTIVLKAAIKGLMAELPPDADGAWLDNLVRSLITGYGYDYNHGTGHGIGILVHEAPPSIIFGQNGMIKLKENMLFSIEPGIYLEGWGGVRIENIVTIVKHPDPQKANAGWLKVKCLTFAPLDDNLIAFHMLDEQELAFLKDYKSRFEQRDPES